MNDTTKHYTHPALGINVYKDNMGYFAQMEKEAQAKLNAEKQKKKNNGFVDALFLWTLVLNPFSWAVYAIFISEGFDDGFVKTFHSMGFFTYQFTFFWASYLIYKLINFKVRK